MSTGGEDVRVHALVSGRVQGVGFRWHTCGAARSLGLGGWVRNLDDGRVELEAVGPREGLQALLDRVRAGPAHAKVTSVDASWHDVAELPTPFEIRR